MNLKSEDVIGILLIVVIFGIPALKSLIVEVIRAARGEKEEDE